MKRTNNYRNSNEKEKRVTEKDFQMALDILSRYFNQTKSAEYSDRGGTTTKVNSRYPHKPHAITKSDPSELILNTSIRDSGLSRKAVNNLKSIDCSGCMADLLKIGRTNLFRLKRLKEYRDEIDSWFSSNGINKWFES